MVLEPAKELSCSQAFSPEDSTDWDVLDSTPSTASSVTPPSLSPQYDVSSSFGDKDCGEPILPQRLIIDFTPDPIIDSLEAQNKCCSFWEFIESQPYCFRRLCVMPEIDKDTTSTKSETSVTSVSEMHATAMFELDRDYNHLIELAFEEKKLIKSKCSLGTEEYQINDPVTRKNMMSSEKSEAPKVCSCTGVCTQCKKAKAASRLREKREAKEICRQFDEWDKKHPKSMDPPGIIMQHMPVLQRKLPPPQDPKTCLD